jgi:hypothetical protein
MPTHRNVPLQAQLVGQCLPVSSALLASASSLSQQPTLQQMGQLGAHLGRQLEAAAQRQLHLQASRPSSSGVEGAEPGQLRVFTPDGLRGMMGRIK